MPFPKKLYVEITTRCNLRCTKCIKQVANNGIVEADMPFATFKKIGSELSTVDQLILNGIGEPLLHPQLESMLHIARKTMPLNAFIGFQTNGVLLSLEKARRLVGAGLSTACLSLDSLSDRARHGSSSQGPSCRKVSKALNNLQTAARSLNNRFQLGLEIVVSQENIHEFPAMLHWAAEHGIHYILVSHLLPYDHAMAAESLFSTNSAEAVTLFCNWQESAQEKGHDLREGMQAYLRYTKSDSDRSAMVLLQKMRQEAAEKNIPLHWENLFSYSPETMAHTRAVFSQAQRLAKRFDIVLSLPPLHAQRQAICPAVEAKAACISVEGEVTPCHFLWHSYPCMSGNDIVHIQQKSFGNVTTGTLKEIWQNREYIGFRAEAAENDFSPCWSCSQGPCEDLINTNLHGANDCFGNIVPCGHCLWGIGGLKCL